MAQFYRRRTQAVIQRFTYISADWLSFLLHFIQYSVYFFRKSSSTSSVIGYTMNGNGSSMGLGGGTGSQGPGPQPGTRPPPQGTGQQRMPDNRGQMVKYIQKHTS